MNIFFSASYRGREQYKTQLDLIHDTIAEFKSVNLISPAWKDNYEPLLRATKISRATQSRFAEYQAIRKGIRISEAVIFEVSHESFQVGHEVSFALAEKKPVLCLSLHEDFSQRIQNEYFFGAKYTPETIHGIIQDFLARVRELSLSKRFNLFLYPHQLEYVKEQGEKMGMNMSEYIRYLINLDKQRSAGY